MRWIREHKLITALLVILLALGIIFVVSVSSTIQDNPVSSVANQGASVVSKGLSTVGNGIRNTVSGILSYRSLQKQVEELEAENLELKLKVSEESMTKEQLEELQDLSELLNYDYTKKKFDIVTADLISMDGSNWTNVFTIGKGTESGIKEGDAVINGNGLVGKVESTGKGWSKVVSIIDDGSKVSFKLARDRKQLGVVSGNEEGGISGYMIDADALISEGDTIITSGLGTYPAGLEIGSVKTVTYNSNTLLKETTVESAVNSKCLDKVAVII